MQREKRCYIKQRLGDSLRDDEYPRLVLGKRPNVTVRHFADKLPIGYDRDPRIERAARAVGAPPASAQTCRRQ